MSDELSAAELEAYRLRFSAGATATTRTLEPAAVVQPAQTRMLDTSVPAARTVTTEPLTAEQLAYLRAELGPETTAAEVQDRWQRLGDPRLVALEVVRERLAALQAAPATFALAGVYSQSTGPNLDAYREQLARLGAPEQQAAQTPAVRVTRTRSRTGR